MDNFASKPKVLSTVFPKINAGGGRLFFRKVARGVYFRPAFILEPAFIFLSIVHR